MASSEENSDTIALPDKILIQDVISLILKNGINSCLDEICTKMSNLTEHKSCVEKDLKAKLAKYKNLNKKKDHPSAAQILKQFLDTPYIGPENILDSSAQQKGRCSIQYSNVFITTPTIFVDFSGDLSKVSSTWPSKENVFAMYNRSLNFWCYCKLSNLNFAVKTFNFL